MRPAGHLGEQLRQAEESAWPADENLEDLPLRRGETDLTLRPGNGPPGDVDDSTSDPDPRCGACLTCLACPPQGGTQACEQFRSVERLGNVVVSTGVQCGNLVRTCRASSQHDEWIGRSLAQALDDVNAVLIRQRQVHDDGVRLAPRLSSEAILTILGNVSSVTVG